MSAPATTSAAAPQYNPNLPSVKRILQEARELEREPSDQFRAAPLEDNLFEWHFTVCGPDGTAFESGRYHGRLLMPAEYPFRPPTIMMLTPNGRFETRKRICLSISDFHPEQWQPAWGVRTIMTALIAFFPTPSDGAIGALDYTADERAKLAARSLGWTCDVCGECMRTSLARPSERRPCGGAACSVAVESAAVSPVTSTEAAPAAADDNAACTEACAYADGAARHRTPVDLPAAAVGSTTPSEVPTVRATAAAPELAESGARASAVPSDAPTHAAQRPAAAVDGALDRFLHGLAIALAVAILALVINKVLKL